MTELKCHEMEQANGGEFTAAAAVGAGLWLGAVAGGVIFVAGVVIYLAVAD